MISVIMKHEYQRLFRTAQTWLIIATISALFGFLFLKQLESFMNVQGQLAAADHPVGLTGFLSVRYLEPLALVLTLLAPLLAMRSFSDEFRQHTYSLWQSTPVSLFSLVLGKYLGIGVVLSFIVLLAVSSVMVMQFFVTIDWRLLSSSFLGLWLCSSSCAACGMYFSSLTKNPLIAIFASLALLALSWIIGSVTLSSLPAALLGELSIANHLRGFFQGYVHLGDIAYFLLINALFISLTVIRLDQIRFRGS